MDEAAAYRDHDNKIDISISNNMKSRKIQTQMQPSSSLFPSNTPSTSPTESSLERSEVPTESNAPSTSMQPTACVDVPDWVDKDVERTDSTLMNIKFSVEYLIVFVQIPLL